MLTNRASEFFNRDVIGRDAGSVENHFNSCYRFSKGFQRFFDKDYLLLRVVLLFHQCLTSSTKFHLEEVCYIHLEWGNHPSSVWICR